MRTRLLIWLLLPLLIATGQIVQAQTFILYNVDLSNYPEIGADLLAVDKQGNPLHDFADSDFTVIDNDLDVSSTVSVECPPATNPGAFDAVLVNDRSGSMVESTSLGLTRFDLLKTGVTAFVQTVDFTPPTMVALTAFDDNPSIISDFRSSPTPLIQSLSSIQLGGGTDYASAFLNPRAGGIPLLETGPDTLRRILVFLTDGYPNEPPPVDQIVAAAQAAHVQIYAITVGTPMNADLRNIAIRTGGLAFGDVSNPEEMRAIYITIALSSKGYGSCHLRWRTSRECASVGASHQVQATLKAQGFGGSTTYLVPPSSFVKLDVSPSVIWFGSAPPATNLDKTITLKAVNSNINITQGTITAGQPFTVLDWGGTPPPFTLRADSSRTITIRFTPPDSGAYNASFAINSTPCPPLPVTLIGGARKHGAGSTLELITPLGGETYSACDSLQIQWTGVTAQDTVTIEYSDDAGLHWHLISNQATGLSYRWMPPIPGTGYRIRISVQASTENKVTTIAGGGSGVDGGPAVGALLSAPTGAAVLDNILYFAESGDNRIRMVDARNGIIQTLAGTGSPGFGGDGGPANAARLSNPNDVALNGSLLFIADYGNHRIRAVNLDDNTITTVAGTGSSAFGGDGGQALAADLQYPSNVLVSGNALYITDAGNNRIRRIDLATGIIRTIAGGGSNPFSDGTPATSAQLKSPAGIAILADSLYIAETGAARVRRVDLRTGIITTIAGTGVPGSGGDNGPAANAQLQGPLGVEVAAGGLFIADANDNRIRRVDLATGIITTFAGTGTAGFSGDGGNARSARFNYPGKPIASPTALIVADIRNNRVRSIAFGRIAGDDQSLSSFTVNVGTVQLSTTIVGKEVKLGSMALGRVRDSVAGSTICNTGNLPLTIDSITIVGANPGDFQVAAGILGTEIPPGTCRSIELIFRPGALGPRSARAILRGRCANADTLLLSGIGIAPCGDTSLILADLGPVAVTAGKDTTLTTAICNRGANRITGTVSIIPADGPFSIVSGGGSFSIGPGECRTVVIRFAPTSPGRVSGFIDYGIPSECGAMKTALYGEGISPQRLQTVDSIAFQGPLCWTGALDTTIRLYNPGSAPLSITEISFTENLEGFILRSPAPSVGAPLTIQPSGVESIQLRLDPLTPGTKHATLRILSNDPNSPTIIELTGRRDSVHAMATSSLLSFGRPTGATYPRDSFVVVRNTGTVPITLNGGSIAGADAVEFDLPAAQFPIVIPPGDSARILVTIRRSAEAGGFNAVLRLTVQPSCDSGVVQVALLQPGALPILAADPPLFAELTCTGGTSSDTSITLRNIGGSPLVITGFTILDDPEGNFSAGPLTPQPLIIQPDGSALLGVRFAPRSHGTKHARLIIRSNSEGDSTVMLDAEWDLISFTLSPSTLSFDTLAPGATADRTVTLTNTGTTALRWSLPASVGRFTVVSILPPVADPGTSSIVTLHFAGGPAADYRDTLAVKELRCGTSQLLPLDAVAVERTTTTITLPVDSALSGIRVLLPVRVTADDQGAFARSGASGFTGTLEVQGIALVVDTLEGATITASSYDPSGRQIIAFSGSLPPRAGNLLMSIGGRTFNGDTTWKVLKLTAFAWDVPGLAVRTVPGLFRVYGPCYNGQEILMAAPKLLKITPMPITGMATIDVDLPIATNLRASLVDARGIERRLLVDHGFVVGPATLQLDAGGLPSGPYVLVLETPFGTSAQTIMIAR